MISDFERSIPDVLPLTALHLHFMPTGRAGACTVCRIDHESVSWRECERCGGGFHETCHPVGIGSVTARAGADVIAADICPGCCS
jgi:hypothetical protein